MSKVKVLIADDHLLIRQGIKSLLQNVPAIKVIGETGNGKDVIHLYAKLKPDVILMDISMPDISGIEASRMIKEKYPKAKILVLTIYKNDDYVLSAVKNGASGVINKDVNKNILVEAILAIAAGKKYFAQELTQLLIENLISKNNDYNRDLLKEKVFLTNRENEILCFIAEGLSTSEIAAKLSLSIRTVETHRTNLMQKLKIKTSSGLARFAFENGLLNQKSFNN